MPVDIAWAFGLDGAMVCVIAFVIFFLWLVYHLRREDKREGYPKDTVGVTGGTETTRGFPPLPREKVFRRPSGKPDVVVPRREPMREAEVRPGRTAFGRPLVPSRDGLEEGVGPAAWQEREDEPDLDVHGNPKLISLERHQKFSIAPGDPDPRGWAVLSDDGQTVGKVSDLWFNRAEFFLRYFEVVLDSGESGVLLPLFFTRIDRRRRTVTAFGMPAARIASAPQRLHGDAITVRDEDRVNAYYAGGPFYGRDPLGPNRRPA